MMFSSQSASTVNNNANGFYGNGALHSPSVNQTERSHGVDHGSLKRRRTDGIDCECHAGNDRLQFKKGKSFVLVPCSDFIYHTEVWKPKFASLYLPLAQDILINTVHVEQISFENGMYFVANSNGEYQRSISGWTTHLWRYNPKLGCLFIARSFLITNQPIFEAFRECLEAM